MLLIAPGLQHSLYLRCSRPFDFIIIGGGTFGAAVAEHLWFRSTNRSERILVLEAGPFLLPEHVQNLPMLALSAAGARKDSRDYDLWNAMDKASDEVAKVFANGQKIDVIKNGRVIATNIYPGSLATVLPYKFSEPGSPGRRDGLGTTHMKLEHYEWRGSEQIGDRSQPPLS